MKLTKERLKQIIKEEFESMAGQNVPNEAVYPEILGSFKEILDSHLGTNYNLYQELLAIAEYSAQAEDTQLPNPYEQESDPTPGGAKNPISADQFINKMRGKLREDIKE
jgi:hypothetical protein